MVCQYAPQVRISLPTRLNISKTHSAILRTISQQVACHPCSYQCVTFQVIEDPWVALKGREPVIWPFGLSEVIRWHFKDFESSMVENGIAVCKNRLGGNDCKCPPIDKLIQPCSNWFLHCAKQCWLKIRNTSPGEHFVFEQRLRLDGGMVSRRRYT